MVMNLMGPQPTYEIWEGGGWSGQYDVSEEDFIKKQEYQRVMMKLEERKLQEREQRLISEMVRRQKTVEEEERREKEKGLSSNKEYGTW